VPEKVTQKELYNDLGIKIIKDEDIDSEELSNICKQIKIDHETADSSVIEKEHALDGVNVYKVELDCNGMYDVDFIGKDKIGQSIILLQEGTRYRPIFKVENDSFKGLYSNDDKIIEQLMSYV